MSPSLVGIPPETLVFPSHYCTIFVHNIKENLYMFTLYVVYQYIFAKMCLLLELLSVLKPGFSLCKTKHLIAILLIHKTGISFCPQQMNIFYFLLFTEFQVSSLCIYISLQHYILHLQLFYLVNNLLDLFKYCILF